MYIDTKEGHLPKQVPYNKGAAMPNNTEYTIRTHPEHNTQSLTARGGRDILITTAGEDDWHRLTKPTTPAQYELIAQIEQLHGITVNIDDLPDDLMDQFELDVNAQLYGRRVRHEVQKRDDAERFKFTEKVAAERKLTPWRTFREKAAANKRKFIVDQFIVQGQFSALGAEKKAGKTLLATDMAISVATGTKFLGTYDTTPARVALYINEGGESDFYRYATSICQAKGIDICDLDGRVMVQFTPPRLDDPEHIETMHADLAAFEPDLVIIDPWYRSAGSADGTNLAEMGTIINNLQGMVADLGAALLVTHHWNKSGHGTGVERWSGSGLAEAARVLINVDAPSAKRQGHKTITSLKIDITGYITHSVRVERQMWAKDPKDPDSPLTYELNVIENLELATVRADDPEQAVIETVAASEQSGTEFTQSDLAKYVKSQYECIRTYEDAKQVITALMVSNRLVPMSKSTTNARGETRTRTIIKLNR